MKMKEGPQMKVLITGSTGLIGMALTKSLAAKGHTVLRLVRSKPKNEGEAQWNPQSGEIDLVRLEGIDAAVHLAGENIAEGRWDDEKKRRIRESRSKGTQLLAETLARLSSKPRVLVSASAIGFYGDRGNEILTEKSASGNDFLSEVCREWELATRPAAQAGIRVVNMRIGVVLSSKGGALTQMLTPFKLGVGGKIGSGKQYMSWVALDDVVGAIEFAVENEELSGPVNLVSPNSATNLEFTKTLGDVISRPTLLFVPAFAARLAFGEMADALLLSSQRVEPTRLKEAGFGFRYPDLKRALHHALKE